MEKDRDFEVYLQMQEERIARLKEASLVKDRHRDAAGESRYTTTPLAKFSDRMAEYERPRTAPGYVPRLNYRKVLCMLVILLVASGVIGYVLWKSWEDESK